MARLFKPSMPDGSLDIQDDHYRRINDLCFRHLAGAWSNYQEKRLHSWIDRVSNNDMRYGRSEYLKSLSAMQRLQSEEYTQSLASVLLSHTWILSAANYYRLTAENKNLRCEIIQDKKTIKKTDSPAKIAKELNVSEDLQKLVNDLHNARNTIMHLVVNRKGSFPIGDIGFEKAYIFAEGTWNIYVALLKHFDRVAENDHWKIQTNLYCLPNTLEDAKLKT